jgi:glycosyltransferase involved in cell wall biosynthesis
MGEIFRQERSPEALAEPADARIGRLHRYYLARAMAGGLDVADLRGGDGSGPAVLAQMARRVVAVVTEPQAARAAFPAGNLTFCADLAEDESADLAVALGMLGRVADPASWLAGLRRTIRQGGRLVLDAPPAGTLAQTRRNFTAAEVTSLLGAQFAHVRVFAQRGMIGSAMLADRAGRPALVFAHPDRLHVEVTQGLGAPDGWVAVASDSALDEVTESLLIDSDIAALAEARASAVQARAELQALQQDHAALTAHSDARRRSDAQWRHELATLRVAEAAAKSRAAALQARHDEIAESSLALLRAADARAAALAEARERALRAECARLQALLDQRRQRPGPALRQRLVGLLPGGRARARAVRASGVFDANWYLANYADVRAGGIDPALHYLRHGAAEGRDPGPDFDAVWYGREHPDLATSGLTAVEHFERHGRMAGWATRPADPPPPDPAPRRENPRVLFVSGEADTPGSQYRCVRTAAAACAAGFSAGWSKLEETGAPELIGVEILVLWRVRFSKHVEGVMREVRQQGGIVVFDVDDLMIRPELAATRVIDGIRTTNAGIGSTRETFAEVQQAMLHADLCSTTTEELAGHMRAFQKATFVLPNGFDAQTLARARRAVRMRARSAQDGLIRIGYAAGTVTHQKDFAVALPGLIRVLQMRPPVRLVLFRARSGPELVVVDEFEALAPFADRIEWRDKVELAELPAELARFDINIAPLEVGNPFCEAKSELKYFEAALVDVPTVASPTGPFARCIAHGRTGMLAADDEDWTHCLLRLVDDAALRRQIGRHAYEACLWPFGPQRRTDLVESFLRQVAGGIVGAQAFALDALRAAAPQPPQPSARVAAEVLFAIDRMDDAQVTVIVPCYNYAEFVIEALESVRAQTLSPLDLIVVDDASSDPLATDLIVAWVRTHEQRFNRVMVLRHNENAGLSAARNTGFAAAETPFVLPLDADNRLHAGCCAALLEALAPSRAAFAYASVRMFGAADSVFCNEPYRPMRMVGGNYIDAMALIGKWAWAAAGGYTMPRSMGWEDFDLWCRLVELGQFGLHVDQVLAEYRVHGGSMVSNLVEIDINKQKMVELVEQRHPWLRLSSRKPHERV